MAQAPEADHPQPEQISFELEHLALTAEHRLELSGRWFGVRGRRFVRPTLTLIGATKRSRSLAELEHKPWAAEDGAHWTAAFSLQDPGEDVEEMELAVAPDIAVSLAPPAELSQLPRERVPSSDAVKAPRETIEMQRLKIRTLEERLERVAGSEVELRSALDRRDAAVEKLEAVLEQGEDQARDQAAAEEERESAERERLAALRERDDARKGWRDAHQGWAEVARERDQTAQERDRALVARDRALAERDQLASELERVAAERDRARDERDRASDQRDQILAERDQMSTDRAVAPVRRPAIAAPEQRPRGTVSRPARGWVVWMTRLFALLVLAATVAAIVVIIHST